MRSILLTGSSIDSLVDPEKSTQTNPVLIEPDSKDQDFMQFTYDLNPLDGLCNKRLLLNSKSLKFTYHSITINNIVYFFRSSESSQQKKYFF